MTAQAQPSNVRPHCRSNASQVVNTMCDKFEMLRVNAAAVSTEVIDLETFGDRTDEVLIRDSVGERVPDPAIPFGLDRGLPVPTTCVVVDDNVVHQLVSLRLAAADEVLTALVAHDAA